MTGTLDLNHAPPALRGELIADADMRAYTSWRAGGRADRLYTPADLDDLRGYLKRLAADEPVHFIGLGSNLLIRDGGVRGTVIHLHGALRELHLEKRRQDWPAAAPAGHGGQYGLVYAEAGVASPKVARFIATHDLVGGEFLAGIPGTVGGALAMNAGCHGHETWEFVSRVLTVDRHGELRRRGPKEFEVGYRHVVRRPAPAGNTGAARATDPTPAPNSPPEGERDGERLRRAVSDEWFVAAWFLFPRGDGAASREEIKRLLDKRMASQPLNLPNAGSVFRNPPGDHAARLIESCGLKGFRLGGAQVSEKHANFIVNVDNATAADIETLIETVRARVADRTGVALTREVRILGERP